LVGAGGLSGTQQSGRLALWQIGDEPTTILAAMRREFQVADVSAAIIAAASLEWPPRTIRLRILDRDGREVSLAARRPIADRGRRP
jgi:hypothetical protein